MSTARRISSKKSCACIGVDKIKPQPLPPKAHGAVNGRILTTLQIRTRLAKRALASRGMLEAVTWSFIPAEHAELFGGGAEIAEAGRKPDCIRHVGHAALAAAGSADRSPAQCRQGLWRRRDLRSLRHL
jgi:hypothetical protein